MAAVWTQIAHRSASGVMAATETAPSAATDGVNLTSVGGLTFYLEADEGQTINADTGQLDLYVFDFGSWKLAPALTLPIPPNSAGNRRILVGSVLVDNPRGRVAAICNGVGLSGGSATVYIGATVRRSPNRVEEA